MMKLLTALTPCPSPGTDRRLVGRGEMPSAYSPIISNSVWPKRASLAGPMPLISSNSVGSRGPLLDQFLGAWLLVRI